MARTKGVARQCSTGGAAPRRQLATKAARKSQSREIVQIARGYKKKEKERRNILNSYMRDSKKKRIALLEQLTEKTIALLHNNKELDEDYVDMNRCTDEVCKDKHGDDYCSNCSAVISEDGTYHKGMKRDDRDRLMKIPISKIMLKICIISKALGENSTIVRDILTPREKELDTYYKAWLKSEKTRRSKEDKQKTYEMPDAVAERTKTDKAILDRAQKISKLSPSNYIIDKHGLIPPQREERKTGELYIEDYEDNDIELSDEDDSDDSMSEGEKRAVQADVPAGDLAAKVITTESTDYKGHIWLERAFKLTRQAQNEYVHDHARTSTCTCTHAHIQKNTNKNCLHSVHKYVYILLAGSELPSTGFFFTSTAGLSFDLLGLSSARLEPLLYSTYTYIYTYTHTRIMRMRTYIHI